MEGIRYYVWKSFGEGKVLCRCGQEFLNDEDQQESGEFKTSASSQS